MKRSAYIFAMGALLVAGPLAGQFGPEARAAIVISARVVEGLQAPMPGHALDGVAGLMAAATVQRSVNGGFAPFDFDLLSRFLSDLSSAQPGVVVTAVLIGPDGLVVSGDMATPDAEDWGYGAVQAGSVWRGRTGYHLFVDVCACNV